VLTRERFVRMFRISAAVEAIHFVEEWSTGFHVRFPALFGLAPWPDRFFAVLCIALVVLWLVAASALVRGKRPALFVAWFFAFTMVVDGLGHSILAVVSIGYFPGLFTSPLVGICGLWLLLRLLDLTDRWSVGIREGGRIDADQ